jgi:hypothetical protein
LIKGKSNSSKSAQNPGSLVKYFLSILDNSLERSDSAVLEVSALQSLDANSRILIACLANKKFPRDLAEAFQAIEFQASSKSPTMKLYKVPGGRFRLIYLKSESIGIYTYQY